MRGVLYERFKLTIEAELKKANDLIKKGIKIENVYAEVMKEAGKPAPNFKLPTAPVKPAGPVKVDDHPEDMAFGPKNAKVTIYEFSDFECPFCSKGADTIDALKKEYGDKIRVVFKNRRVLPQGRRAAARSYAAGKQGKFWEMHDKLFDTARSEPTPSRASPKSLGWTRSGRRISTARPRRRRSRLIRSGRWSSTHAELLHQR